MDIESPTQETRLGQSTIEDLKMLDNFGDTQVS
jgi:hypothetical protein